MMSVVIVSGKTRAEQSRTGLHRLKLSSHGPRRCATTWLMLVVAASFYHCDSLKVALRTVQWFRASLPHSAAEVCPSPRAYFLSNNFKKLSLGMLTLPTIISLNLFLPAF